MLVVGRTGKQTLRYASSAGIPSSFWEVPLVVLVVINLVSQHNDVALLFITQPRELEEEACLDLNSKRHYSIIISNTREITNLCLSTGLLGHYSIIALLAKRANSFFDKTRISSNIPLYQSKVQCCYLAPWLHILRTKLPFDLSLEFEAIAIEV